MHLTSLSPAQPGAAAPVTTTPVTTTLALPHCGPLTGVDFVNVDTNTVANVVEPDAVCGNVSVDVTSSSTFFKTLGTYLKTMFKCLFLAYKGWAHDKWALSALKTNRRWLYISLSILFLVLFIVIIAVIISLSTSSTAGIKAKLADVKQKEEAQAVAERQHVQAELRPQQAASYTQPYSRPYRGDEVPVPPSTLPPRTFDYGASSSYQSPTSPPFPTSGSFSL